MQAFARSLVLAALVVGVVLWGNPASAQGTDPLIGTWKLNVAKSKYSPGPPPKSNTVRIEAAGEGQKTTADGIGANGQPTHVEYTAKYDGKDYPITGSAIGADTVSLKRVDANTTKRTDKKGGKIVATMTRKVSRDGKRVTVTYKGIDAKGQPFDNVVVYEKQ